MSKVARPHDQFDFRSGSIGNFLLTGARLFFGSLESAIYLLSSIARIPPDIQVLPVINSNHTHNIAVSLEDGSIIVGQSQISHPATFTENDQILGSLGVSQLQFNKSSNLSLPSRVRRVFYVDSYANVVSPSSNSKVIDSINSSRMAIFSIGSLYTSILPTLIPSDVVHALSTSPTLIYRILILNSDFDREVSHFTSALDFIQALEDALSPPVLTHLIYTRNCRISVPVTEINAKGIVCVGLQGAQATGEYTTESLSEAFSAISSGMYSSIRKSVRPVNRSQSIG